MTLCRPQRVPPMILLRPPDGFRTNHGKHIARLRNQFLASEAWDETQRSSGPRPFKGFGRLGKTRTALSACKAWHESYKGQYPVLRAKRSIWPLKQSALQRVNSDIPSFVLRGRSAINPRTSAVCARAPSVEKEIAKNVSSVTRPYVERTRAGRSSEAALPKRCPYLAQEHTKATHRVSAHSI